MPSTFRIPKATITGLYGKVLSGYARRTYGQIPDGVHVYWHHRKVLKAVLGFEQKVAKWDRLDEDLKSYAQLASAGVIGCSWCLDFGYFKAHNDGLDLALEGQDGLEDRLVVEVDVAVVGELLSELLLRVELHRRTVETGDGSLGDPEGAGAGHRSASPLVGELLSDHETPAARCV